MSRTSQRPRKNHSSSINYAIVNLRKVLRFNISFMISQQDENPSACNFISGCLLPVVCQIARWLFTRQVLL